jgi:hypothetical protein
MKKLRHLQRLDEYNYSMNNPKTTPEPVTTPTPDKTKDPRPDIDPFNPPKPLIQPEPKNWKMILKKCVERFNKLYQENPEIIHFSLAESIKKNPAVPAYKKLRAELPKPDMGKYMELGMSAMQTMLQIGEIEQQNFSDEELESIALDIVRKIVSGSALEKKGVDFDQLNFDIKFVRSGEDLGKGVRKAPADEEHDEEMAIKISRRELTNTLSQGFGITSQARMFDEDVSDIMDKIDSVLLQNYFKLMKDSLESHKYMDPDFFLKAMQQMQNAQDFAEENEMDAPSSSHIVPAKMEVIIEGDKYVIKVQAYCLIFAIQEMVKGIFEVVSYHALSGNKEQQEAIFKEADNWFIEYEGFVYGPRLVQIFREFFKEVEDFLIRKGAITEYDETMLYKVLSAMYTVSYMNDEEFIETMSLIFNEELDQDLWPVEKIAEIYEHLLSFSKKGGESEEMGYEGGYGEEAEDDYDSFQEIMKKSKEIETEEKEVPTLDELLDKIGQYGKQSLTPEENELLIKYSQNMSMVHNFDKYIIVMEAIKRN